LGVLFFFVSNPVYNHLFFPNKVSQDALLGFIIKKMDKRSLLGIVAGGVIIGHAALPVIDAGFLVADKAVGGVYSHVMPHQRIEGTVIEEHEGRFGITDIFKTYDVTLETAFGRRVNIKLDGSYKRLFTVGDEVNIEVISDLRSAINPAEGSQFIGVSGYRRGYGPDD
jgi:hypothetical protein